MGKGTRSNSVVAGAQWTATTNKNRDFVIIAIALGMTFIMVPHSGLTS